MARIKEATDLCQKIVKKTKVDNVKCYLRKVFLYGTPNNILYWTISASDGFSAKATSEIQARDIFDKLVAFEKLQTQIKFETDQQL